MMNMTDQVKSLDFTKACAKRLRAYFNEKTIEISHSDSLEAISKAFGHRDWNSCSAALKANDTGINDTGISDKDFCPHLGDLVKGSFRDQALTGQVIALQMVSPKPKYAPGAIKVKIKFDSPVDVVTSERMEGLRSYLWLYLDEGGHTIDRLGRSDGNGCFKVTG